MQRVVSTYFVCCCRFGALLPYEAPQELDLLSEEFTEYQFRIQIFLRMDVLWHHFSSMKAVDNSFRFPRLSKVAKLVLTIPHSNALFSMVRKNKTAFRPSLDPKGTLSSILAIKLAAREPAHCFEPPKEVLSQAKVATWEYNKVHSKK